MSDSEDLVEFLESFEHTGIYVIDRETMEVYYENKTAKKYTVKDRIGQPCYLAHGNKSMCATCPLRNKERISYVHREDHGMVFSVSAKETVWRGIPTYTVIVEKDRDLPKRKSLSEESLERMNRALHSSIISYVDVNMGDETCQAIHFSSDGQHRIFDMPYDEYMRKICFSNYVFAEDHIRGAQVLGIENFRALSGDSEGPSETSVRFRVRGDNGEIHVLESTAYILRDELPHHISIMAREVTQEEQGRVQLSLYNKLVSSAVTTYQLNLTQNTFINVVGYDLMTTRVQERLDACRTIDEFYRFVQEYTVGEAEKKKAAGFLDREMQLRLFAQNQSILRERLPIDMDDGSYMWLDITCNMLRDPVSGDVEAILYSEAVDENVVSENMINQMIQNDYDYVAVFDLINHTNQVFTASARYNKEDMERNLRQENRENYLRKIYAGDDVETFIYHNSVSYIRQQLAVHDKFDNFYYVYEDDGTVSYKKETLSYLSGDKRYFVLSRTDHTGAVKSQQELNMQLQSALNEAKKATEEKTELFARMSHDLRTPMNGILGMTALARHEDDLDVLHSNLRKIDIAGKYMLRMVNDTLDMKRIENGNLILKPKLHKCREFIDSLSEMILPSIEEKHLEFGVENQNIDLDRYAMFDDVRMKQIFTNVMSNAVKFTPEDGKVQFSMMCLKHENGVDHDMFEISDTGIGMSREFLKTGLFEPYEQENNELTGRYAGPGLGLAITKKLVELMGGKIQAESEQGEGTTIRIYLDIPIVDDGRAREMLEKRENRLKSASEKLAGKRILLCEDHPLNAEISRKLLERVGCEVLWARDGEEGLCAFEASETGSIDAILMDIRMPKMDGIQAAKAIRNLTRRDARTVPIIAMTANAFEEDKKATREAGMNEHLAKPVVSAVLYGVLERMMEV